MSIGTSFAIARLRKLGVFCISPNRVNIGGKVNLMCFDKTGTLTEDGLDILGVRAVDRSEGVFSELYTDVEDVPIIGAADAKTPLLHALATCHALKLVNGEVIGDPLDLRMFEFTRWTLEEGKEGTSRPSTDEAQARRSTELPRKSIDKAGARIPERPATLVQTIVRPPGGASFQLEDALKASGRVRLTASASRGEMIARKQHAHFLELGVIRTFDFVSSLRRMSVLVKKLKSQSVEVYVKGAPEVMTEICDKSTRACPSVGFEREAPMSRTVPEDYEELLASYTRHGFRVIALAAKSIPTLTWIKAQRLKRCAKAWTGPRFARAQEHPASKPSLICGSSA
jgi:cation-transporting ATPase 13A3/4/5